jgi:AraC family transcriptional regulator of arabinose operon
MEFIAAGAMNLRGGRSRKWIPVPAGTLVLVQPDTRYWEEVPDGSTEIFAVFQPRPEWLPLLRWTAIEPGLMIRPLGDRQPDVLAAAGELLLHSQARSDAARHALSINALERMLLLGALAGPTAEQPAPMPQIQAAMAFLDRHLTDKVSIPDLARAVKMSPSSLSHRFREQVGEPPAAYHERLRLVRARELLLSTNRRIKDIAALTGFRNAYGFSTRFHHRTGQSPRDYRRSPRAWGERNGA